MFTASDLFEIAVQMERNGEATYLKALEKVKDRKLQKMLQWMADEEARHAKWFSSQRQNVSFEVDEKHLKEMVPGVLQDMMGDNTLSLDEVDFNSFETVSDLLKTFVEFEEETITFYQLLEMFAETEDARQALEIIINEEKAHVEKLTLMAESTCETLG